MEALSNNKQASLVSSLFPLIDISLVAISIGLEYVRAGKMKALVAQVPIRSQVSLHIRDRDLGLLSIHTPIPS